MNTLTETIEQLKTWQCDLIYDVSSDFIEDDDRRKMKIQLDLLTDAIARLELILSDENGQIFESSIPR